MSVLGDAVIARDTAGRLVNLTNSASNSGRAATTVNAVVLAAAEADATAEFKTRAGETFDEANPQHVQIAVPGVWAFLALWKGQAGAKDQMSKFADACDEYRGTRGNSRVVPIVGGVGAPPSPDVDEDGPRRPEFDRTRFRDLSPVPPTSDEGS